MFRSVQSGFFYCQQLLSSFVVHRPLYSELLDMCRHYIKLIQGIYVSFVRGVRYPWVSCFDEHLLESL